MLPLGLDIERFVTINVCIDVVARSEVELVDS